MRNLKVESKHSKRLSVSFYKTLKYIDEKKHIEAQLMSAKEISSPKRLRNAENKVSVQQQEQFKQRHVAIISAVYRTLGTVLEDIHDSRKFIP